MLTEQEIMEHPLHESIVKEIFLSSHDSLRTLIAFIKVTKLTEGHDEVIAAVEKKWEGLSFWEKEVAEIKTILLKQKQSVEKPLCKKTDFNNLQRETEDLLLLLENYNSGSSSKLCQTMLHDQLEELQIIISQALGK